MWSVRTICVWVATLVVVVRGELLQNGGFQSLTGWDCWSPIHCALTTGPQAGQSAVQVTGRAEGWQGPSQYITVKAGFMYNVSAFVKVTNDKGQGQEVHMELDFQFTDNTHDYVTAANFQSVRVADGWVRVQGGFVAPTNKPLQQTRIYFEGPAAGVEFAVAQASVTELDDAQNWRAETDSVIEQLRKGDIHVRVTTAAGIDQHDIQIQIIQTKKSFPFGTVVVASDYNNNVGGGRYRQIVHDYFNWGVPANALKWYAIEPQQGQRVFQPALDMINGLHAHGLKVRGHNLVWSVEQYIQGWIKQLSGDTLRQAINHHVTDTLNETRGLLEHWDVNNEILHGHWFTDTLHDPNFNTDLFRLAHTTDPNVKLFLNEYNVVSFWGATNRYLAQALQLKAANVGLYGVGAQCHFSADQDPDPNAIKNRLDILAQAGLPIWITELDVKSSDDSKTADYIERALRATYGHPAVEGILLWMTWGGIARTDTYELTPAGHRMVDLFQNQWMTDETHTLSQQHEQFTVRGFHGDYEARVHYQGRELTSLKTTFTLNKGSDHTVNINVHL